MCFLRSQAAVIAFVVRAPVTFEPPLVHVCELSPSSLQTRIPLTIAAHCQHCEDGPKGRFFPGALHRPRCHMKLTSPMCPKYIVKSGLESRAESETRCVAMFWNDVEKSVLKNAALEVRGYCQRTVNVCLEK